jgi:predicted small lipoprotein YifL
LPHSGGELTAGNGLGSIRNLLRCCAILETDVPQANRHHLRFLTLGVLVAMTLLAGCGRKGPLDPPPSSSSQAPPASVQSNADDASSQPAAKPGDFGTDGRPIAPRGAKKRLPGDALID